MSGEGEYVKSEMIPDAPHSSGQGIVDVRTCENQSLIDEKTELEALIQKYENEDIPRLESENDNLRQDYQEMHQSALRAFEEKNKEISDEQAKNKSLNENLLAEKNEKEALRAELSIEQANIESLDQKLSAEKNEKEALRAELSNEQAKIKSLDQELSANWSDIQSLRAEFSSQQAKNDELKKELSAKNEHIEHQEGSILLQQKENERLRMDNRGINDEKDKSLKTIKDLQDKLDLMSDLNKGFEEQLKRQKELEQGYCIVGNSTEKTKHQAEVESLNKIIQGALKRSEDAELEQKKLELRLEEFKKETDADREKYERVREAADRYRQECDKRQVEIDALKSDLESKKTNRGRRSTSPSSDNQGNAEQRQNEEKIVQLSYQKDELWAMLTWYRNYFANVAYNLSCADSHEKHSSTTETHSGNTKSNEEQATDLDFATYLGIIVGSINGYLNKIISAAKKCNEWEQKYNSLREEKKPLQERSGHPGASREKNEKVNALFAENEGLAEKVRRLESLNKKYWKDYDNLHQEYGKIWSENQKLSSKNKKLSSENEDKRKSIKEKNENIRNLNLRISQLSRTSPGAGARPTYVNTSMSYFGGFLQ